MLSALLAAALAFTPADARFARSVASGLVDRHTPRDAGTPQGRAAAEYLLKAVRGAGVDARLDEFEAKTPKGVRRFANIEAEVRTDPAAPWVVLLSHFDTKPGTNCPGANDGAATSGLLVAVARAAARAGLARGNILFVWTDGEECMESYAEDDGFWGSRRAAERLRARGVDVRGVICADMIGDRDLGIEIPRNVTPALAAAALAAASKVGALRRVARTDMLVKDDHVPFLDAGFKAVDLIDFSYGSAPGLNDYWHTPKDTMDKVSETSLRTSGSILVEMTGILLK